MRIGSVDITPAQQVPSEVVEVDIEPEVYFEDPGLFHDKKEYARWMDRMKRKIRKNLELTSLISFEKHCCGMDACGIHPNMTLTAGIRIEAHHTPLTLEDIVHIIVTKRLITGESLKMDAIGGEVVRLHYLRLVGLYPLCQLCHKAIHSTTVGDKFFIPLDAVRGNPVKFMEIYHEYIPEPIKIKWENLKVLNAAYRAIQEHHMPPEVQRKYIYVAAPGSGETISTEKLINFIRSA